MKKGIVVLIVGAACISIPSCGISKKEKKTDLIQGSNKQIDSLEQARLNRLDSSAQIKINSNTPSNSFTNPPKTVKKKVIKD